MWNAQKNLWTEVSKRNEEAMACDFFLHNFHYEKKTLVKYNFFLLPLNFLSLSPFHFHPVFLFSHKCFKFMLKTIGKFGWLFTVSACFYNEKRRFFHCIGSSPSFRCHTIAAVALQYSHNRTRVTDI